ncbi:thiol-disulfide isomerase/thioredoxin [Pedobacter sp. AK017]|uniref:TlpA family protein disulfide reductase n=1 Tax=Pedobacter sp. AK017 TaxID=2723073 RepID=UPI0016172DF6|nr:TlpA disulfide reductase family protein [Pedobacter sp. AK017]MBB5441280.1 thiol-disulfide isomerase/thioredoxin [Pedobacter sp. AK017]
MKSINRYFSLLLLFSLSTVSAIAQKKTEIQPLKVGQQCPDFLFSDIVTKNGSKNPVYLSDFKGKLVVLDFWATWCASCIEGIPKLDSLQNKFGENVVIIPVTNQATEPVAAFIRQNHNFNGSKLFYVTRDSTLSKYFPFRIMGQKVWIDGGGKVVAITDHRQTTEENIRSAIEAKYSSIKQKTADILEKRYNKPLYAGYFGDTYMPDGKQIQYQSMLTGYIDGAGDRNTQVIDNGRIIRTVINWAPVYMYQLALMREKGIVYQYQGDYSERLISRVQLEVKDSTYFSLPSFSPAQKQKYRLLPDSLRGYTYQQIIPAKDSLMGNDYMLEDLNRYFGNKLGIEGLIGKRKVKCFALMKISNQDIRNKSNAKPYIDWSTNKDYVKMKNWSFKLWFRNLLMFYMQQSPVPIINESGYENDLVDIEVDGDLKDPISMNKSLKKYGLEFQLVERELEMIIIRDRK